MDNLVTVTFPSTFRSDMSRTRRRRTETFTVAAVSDVRHDRRRTVGIGAVEVRERIGLSFIR